MIAQLTPKERLGYLALGFLLLAIVGVVGYRAGAREKPANASLSLAANPPTQPTPQATKLVIDVAGEVKRPGVYTLDTNARTVDAVKAAGGATSTADLDSVNLAEKLTDGEQIRIPTKGENASSDSQQGPTVSGGKNGKILSGKISLNAAALQDLEELPGVGPATAQKILDWRTSHGAFKSVDQLKDVGGIGDKKLARIAPFVKL